MSAPTLIPQLRGPTASPTSTVRSVKAIRTCHSLTVVVADTAHDAVPSHCKSTVLHGDGGTPFVLTRGALSRLPAFFFCRAAVAARAGNQTPARPPHRAPGGRQCALVHHGRDELAHVAKESYRCGRRLRCCPAPRALN